MKRQFVFTAMTAAVLALVVTVREARSGDSVPRSEAPSGEASSPAPGGSTCTAPEPSATPLGAQFWGCWTYFPSGPCRAVYRNDDGSYSLCGRCGPSGEPNPNQCGPITTQTLAIGYWCS